MSNEPTGNTDRSNTVSVVIRQEQDGAVLSERVAIRYPNLLVTEANAMNVILSDAVDDGLIPAIAPLAEAKAELLGQGEVWERMKHALPAGKRPRTAPFSKKQG